ncbi:hypothetical protein CDAR_417361 [Caerostris darwini]|uniref:Uncharacterized protein n=1 Tax=Caerostris darwini TaxID=1538125 RepID=A0AAV4X684_9ARAC|nr:hypothetical protein CDAR_417361 [Caerostris darwini]
MQSIFATGENEHDQRRARAWAVCPALVGQTVRMAERGLNESARTRRTWSEWRTRQSPLEQVRNRTTVVFPQWLENRLVVNARHFVESRILLRREIFLLFSSSSTENRRKKAARVVQKDDVCRCQKKRVKIIRET